MSQIGFRNCKGVTLLELLVVIGIMSILLTLGYIGFQRTKANYDLTSAANTIYGDIQCVRQKSMGSAHLYGIKFFSNGYTIFEDSNDNQNYDSSGPNPDKTIKTVSFKNISLNISLSGNAATLQIIFSRRGIPNRNGTITLTNQFGKTKQIAISQFRVKIQ